MEHAFWFGLVGTVTGVVSLSWNFIQVFLDRPRIKVDLMLGRMYPDHMDRDYLVFTITNVSRRPVLVKGIMGKYKHPKNGHPNFVITPRALPRMLKESEFHLEYYDVDKIPVENVKCLAVYTSTDKEYYVPLKQFKRAMSEVRGVK